MTSKRINLMLFMPEHPRFYILKSHLEVIESLKWGFEALGFDCLFRTNIIDHTEINIVFGWITALNMGLVESFPEGTIFYNFEQFSTTPLKGMAVAELAASRFQIWDYAQGNIARWKEINPKFPPYYAPVSYAPCLSKIAPAPAEDIDIMYIGSLGEKRAEKLKSCSAVLTRPSLMVLSGVWDRHRDNFIARAKILLNISNETPGLEIFEIVRVSYYIANKKAVVCEALPNLEIESDLRDTLIFVPAEELPAACVELLESDDRRADYAARAFEIFSQRDVRTVIRNFFC